MNKYGTDVHAAVATSEATGKRRSCFMVDTTGAIHRVERLPADPPHSVYGDSCNQAPGRTLMPRPDVAIAVLQLAEDAR